MTGSTHTAVEATTFEATFTIAIDALRTTSVGKLNNVIKQVDWTLTGQQAGQTFNLPQTTTLSEPDSADFIELAELTAAKVAEWIESSEPRLNGIKVHIQLVLNKYVAQASLTKTQMPWAPVVEMPMPMPMPMPNPNQPEPVLGDTQPI